MGNESTEILLKISADIEGIKAMHAQFTKLKDGVRESGKEVETLGEKLKNLTGEKLLAFGAAFKLGSIGIESMIESVKGAITGTSELASEMRRVTVNTGLAGEAAQILSKGGRIAFDDLTTKLQKYRATLGEALLDRKGGAANMLRDQLGLDPEALSAKPMQEQLELVAEGFGKVRDVNVQARLAMELFGRNSGQMLVVMEKLRKDGFEGLGEKVRETSGILSDQMAGSLRMVAHEAHEAENRLSIAFAESNLKLLKIKAAVAEFMADNASALLNLGQSLAAAGVGYGIFLAIAKNMGTEAGMGFGARFAAGFASMSWSSLLTPVGATIAVVLGGLIINGIADAMMAGIEAGDKRVIAAYGKGASLLKSSLNTSDPSQVAKNVETARTDMAAAQALAGPLQKRIKDAGVPAGMETRDTNTLALLQQRIKADQTVIDSERAATVGAQARQDAAKKLEAEAAALVIIKEINKAKKETVEHDEREQLLLDAADGSYDDKLKALNAAIASVRKEYDVKRESIKAGVDGDEKQKAMQNLRMSQNDDERAFIRQKDSILRSMDAEQLAFMRSQAEHGTLQQQIDARRAEQYAVLTDKSKTFEQSQRRILEIDQEITKLVDDDATKARVAASELAQREQAAEIAAIKQDQFLTEKERKAKLLLAYQKEAAALPSQIAAADSLVATSERGSSGQTAAQAEAKRLRDRQAGIGNDLTANKTLSIFDQVRVKMAEMQNGFATIASSISGVMQSAINGISNSMTGLIMGTMSWGSALRNIGSSILSGVVGAISRMFAEWIVGRLAQSAVHKAATISEGATETAAKTPGAILSSISSWGVAAAVGVAAVIAAMAMFDKGGYTGDGAVHETAGIVHKGEVVFSQRDVARAGGVQAVESMRVSGGAGGRGQGMASGGGSPAVGSGAAGVNIAYFNTRQDAESWLQSQPGRRTMLDFIKGNKFEL